MAPEFDAAPDAGAWQISTIQVLSAAPLHGSLQIFAEAGIEAVRAKSLRLTRLPDGSAGGQRPDRSRHTTTRSARRARTARRGGHVAVEHAAGPQIVKALKARGVVPDFRPPNVIRLAPIALYTSFGEVWQVVQHLKAIIDGKEHEAFAAERDLVA